MRQVKQRRALKAKTCAYCKEAFYGISIRKYCSAKCSMNSKGNYL